MKKIGLVGGLTWVSTLEYYRIINQLVNERLGGDEAADMVIESVNFGEIKRLTVSENRAGIARMMTEAAQRLVQAGAECVLLGANTMHMVAEEVAQAIPVPLIHIAKVTAAAIQERGMHRVALLGTQYTMRLPFYTELLRDAGITTMIPEAAGIQMVNQAIYGEMAQGVFLNETKQKFIALMQELVEQGAQGIILGCTEIPVLVKPADTEIPLFDTTFLHARAAVDFALSPA